MTINIVGSGLAGLLAANMLRHRSPQIFEQQTELPNNHSAVLRFRSSQVGDVLGIPFRKVNMIKAVDAWRNPVADALAYSYKNTATFKSDRSIISGLTQAERFIAPADLVARMASNLDIHFDAKVDFSLASVQDLTTISTVPMPLLMRALEYEHRFDFKYRDGVNIVAKVENCDAYVSVYVPDPVTMISRVSITGDNLIIELPYSFAEIFGVTSKIEDVTPESIGLYLAHAASLLGIPFDMIHDVSVKRQKYAKIIGIDDDLRKEFIHWATVNHNIYSLGRFATWRPGLLLDDLVNDIRMIDRWSHKNSKYDIARTQ